jgi:GNAT superfamily N-acetyltransferase
VDDSILADLNFFEMCRTITRNAGGRILEADGVLLWAGAHPSPAIINGLMRMKGGVPDSTTVLDLAARWFGELGHGYGLHTRVGIDDDLESHALEQGFFRLLELPVMVHDGPPPDLPAPDGYTLSPVTDADGIRDLVDAVSVPFELPDEIASAFARPESVLSPFVAAVVARDAGGGPVAAAWTCVSHGFAGIGFVGTLEAARGRGLGAAVTAAAMRLGADMGAQRSVLQASPMGRPVYARIGFREVGRYRLLVDPASARGMQAAH